MPRFWRDAHGSTGCARYRSVETDVRAETLEAAADLLTLRRDAIWVIDGTEAVELTTKHSARPQLE